MHFLHNVNDVGLISVLCWVLARVQRQQEITVWKNCNILTFFNF
jgi:hypothetical protein